MSLSKEELLSPRYKIIAGDTSGNLTVGKILTLDDEMNIFWCDAEPFTADRLDLYPHLFQKLEWWQERTKEDMPKYVIDDEGIMGELGGIYSHNLKNCVMVTYPNGNAVVSHLDNFKPVSEEEYNQYIPKQATNG